MAHDLGWARPLVLGLVLAGCSGRIGGGSGGLGPSGELPDPIPLQDGLPVPPPSRVVRLDEVGYQQTVATLFEGRATAPSWSVPVVPLGNAPFSLIAPSDRFSTRNASYVIDGSDLADVERNATELSYRYVESQVDESCVEDPNCRRNVVAQAGALLLRRPMDAGEVSEILAVEPGFENPSHADQLQSQIKALLLSPAFLFRSEIGESQASEATVSLTPAELASALSFTIAQRPPDTLLYAAIENGQLSDDFQVELHIDRLLGSTEHHARVAKFLQEFWRYSEATNVAKDETPRDVFPSGTPGAETAQYQPDALVEETDLLVKHLVETALESSFLKTLLTSSLAYVRKSSAIFYNLTSESDDPERVTLGTRQGLMSQPAWLVAFSEPDHNNPIRRGLFIQESLLCGHIPDIPIDGVPVLDRKNRTLREALSAHRNTDSSCFGCHQFMDPLGLPFEQFDHFGRFRTEELGAPVDTSGRIAFSGGELDVLPDVDGPEALASALAASEQVERCFLAHAFEFWLGRSLTPGDEPVLELAHRIYRESGGNFNRSLKVLLLSDIFRKRTVEQ
jgi:hypothetical protein